MSRLWSLFGAVYSFRASLQLAYGGAVSVRAGITEVDVLLDPPLYNIGDVSLKWQGQFDQVDDGGAPNNNVCALVSGGNVLGEVVLTWKVGSDLHSRWHLQKSKMTARISSCLEV